MPEFEKKTGHKVTVENDTAGALARRRRRRRIFRRGRDAARRRWRRCSAAKLVESSAKPLARVGIGVSIKQGAPVPDISTVDAFKQSLLKARAIAYTDPASGGTAGTYLANLFEKMGIAAELKPKTVLVKGGLAGEKLITGEADIAMQPSSELLAVPGTVLVGPIPLDVQTYILYSGATSVASRTRRPPTSSCGPWPIQRTCPCSSARGWTARNGQDGAAMLALG